ncbi:MAG: SIS domain-containing protein, partial [Nitriliruptorales bacterium]
GMGGSGITADVAAVAARDRGRVPVIAAKEPVLPAFVGPRTLVVGVSHSGNTAETVESLAAARAAHAPCYVITSGGALAEQAAAWGCPVATVPGDGQPRANLAALVTALLTVLERAGAVDGVLADLDGLPRFLDDTMRKWRGDVPLRANPVKQLASDMGALVPLFYAARGWMGIAALRGKSQVNENAERPAFWNELPELAHNELVAWTSPHDVSARAAVVLLRSADDETADAARRFELLADVVADRAAHVATIHFEGPSALARFAAAAAFVDLLSVYLAFLGGVDPTPVGAIDAFKRGLSYATERGEPR